MQHNGQGRRSSKPRVNFDTYTNFEPNSQCTETPDDLAEYKQYLLQKSNTPTNITKTQIFTSKNNNSLSDHKRKSIMTSNLNYLRDKVNVLTNIKKFHLSQFKEIYSNKNNQNIQHISTISQKPESRRTLTTPARSNLPKPTLPPSSSEITDWTYRPNGDNRLSKDMLMAGDGNPQATGSLTEMKKGPL
jgi:hypothetical protein